MLYIFDKDGTICQSKTGQKFINSVADQQLIPGVAEKCAELKAAGHLLAVASNQGGVAFGIMDYATASDIVEHAMDLIRADDWMFCPHHPDGEKPHLSFDCNCRKPKPGMIDGIGDHLGVPLENITYIGDLETDRQAAEAAGVKFIWAKEFFGR